METSYQIERKNYEKVTEVAKRWLIPNDVYLTSVEIKSIERAEGKDYRKGYLTKGKFTEEDFSLVMEYLEQFDKIPVTEKVFYEGLTDFLLKDREEKVKESYII